ncbi:hypothetical protein [Streptomyces sp. AC555_RSS877]|uniref:hypothetical protein n=1 Tax=Streptomyces sp. AC555_RSS877 TaxID=2823688 RepID=UPI001C278CE7|nr:hypothetical protein [Streptomyces sp. AC555_RSS877]
MTLDQLPGRVREFANYLDGLLGRLDQSAGWCGVFWQRDPDGMQACLDGREIPPWDVVEALLQDLSTEYGSAFAAPEADRARALHAAALVAHDARPGGRDALGDRFDVMLREQRYAAERQAELGRFLASATTQQEADVIRLDLAWARDDHERATRRCAELRARIEDLERRSVGGKAEEIRRARAAEGGAVFRVGETDTRTDGRGASGLRPDGRDGYGAPSGGREAYGAPSGGRDAYGTPSGGRDAYGRSSDGREAHAGPSDGRGVSYGARPDGREASYGARSDGHDGSYGDGFPGMPQQRDLRFAAAVEDDSDAGHAGHAGQAEYDRRSSPERQDPAFEEPSVPQEQPAATPKQRKRRRGSARFAGLAEEEAAPVVVPPTAVPDVPAAPVATGRGLRGARYAGTAAGARPQPRSEPLDTVSRREAAGTVERLVRLRGEGRSGEAHALLAELAYWPAVRYPLLAAEMQRAGLGADWATLLWEAASLPPDRLVAVADALASAGLGSDGEQVLRQGVVRPADELGRAVLELAAQGRRGDARALLDAYVRVRTAEEAVRSVEPDPQILVPLLLEAARDASAELHRDLAHALRVAGFSA